MKLTHGEAHVIQISSMRLKDGEWTFDAAKGLRRMKREPAFAYYNKKFYRYWLSKIDKKIPKEQREFHLCELLLKNR